MDIDAFVTNNDQTRVYECKYYHDPSLWKEASLVVKTAIQSLTWSDYIKYLDSEGKLSKELDNLPNNSGGLYLFLFKVLQCLPLKSIWHILVVPNILIPKTYRKG